jgi:hypothetical protein
MRNVNEWSLIIGNWDIPREVSMIVVLILGTMSVSGFRILLKK